MSATISLLFGLLAAIVALDTIATRLRIPYAILLVGGSINDETLRLVERELDLEEQRWQG